MSRRTPASVSSALVVLCFSVFAADLSGQASRLASRQLPPGADLGRSFPIAAEVDDALNGQEYPVGCGDAFQVSVLGFPSLSYTARVNANGDILFPDLGLLRLGMVCLDTARQRIARFVDNSLKAKGEVYVVLSMAKTAAVSVVGEVAQPGTYRLPGTSRVLDAIRTANGDTIPLFERTDYRDVHVQREGAVLELDMFKYLLRGDRSQNPYVLPGDVVVVSGAARAIHILGEVAAPSVARLPLRQHETLADVLALLTLRESADTTQVLLQRGGTVAPDRLPVPRAEWANTALEDGDLLVVPRRAGLSLPYTAFVTGEVKCAGEYPVGKLGITVAELVALAGGPTPEAAVGRAAIVRRSKEVAEALFRRQEERAGLGLSGISSMGAVRPQVAAALSRMLTIGDHDVIHVSGPNDTVKVVHGDVVVVPRGDGYVYISGSVRRPGGYAFSPGKRLRAYVRDAGGYSRRADRSNTFLVSRYGNNMQMTHSNEISDGDIIVVPDAGERPVLTSFVLPLLTAITTSLSLIIAILGIASR